MKTVIPIIFLSCLFFSCKHSEKNEHTLSGIPISVAQSMHEWVNEMNTAHYDTTLNMFEVDVHTGEKTEIKVHSDTMGHVIHANVKMPAVIVPEQIMKNIRFGYPGHEVTDVDIDYYRDSTWLVIGLRDSTKTRTELKKLILP